MREIVSKQTLHNGGTARVERDSADHLFVTCSGCGTEEYVAGMAPALGKLVAEHGGEFLDR